VSKATLTWEPTSKWSKMEIGLFV